MSQQYTIISPFRDLQGGGRVRNSDDDRRIGGGNAARVYGFDLEARAPLAERAGPTVGELARPLDRLPDRPNEALLKAAGISGR